MSDEFGAVVIFLAAAVITVATWFVLSGIAWVVVRVIRALQ